MHENFSPSWLVWLRGEWCGSLPDKNDLIAAATRVQNILNHAWDTFADTFWKKEMFSLNNSGSSIYQSAHKENLCSHKWLRKSVILVSIALLFVHTLDPPYPFVVTIYLFSDPYPCHDTYTTSRISHICV